MPETKQKIKLSNESEKGLEKSKTFQKDFPISDKSEKIKKDMSFSEILEKYPKTAPIMLKHGLHCIGCHVAAFETLEQGCMAHGMKQEDMKKMLKEMNEAVKD